MQSGINLSSSSTEAPIGWETLLKSFFGDEQFTLVENTDSLTLISTNSHFANKIQHIFSTPETLITSLNYTLQEATAESEPPKTITESHYPPISLLDINTGKTLFEKLFQPQFLTLIGYPEMVDEVNQQLLHAIATQDIDLTTLQINKYKKILASATYEELRFALTSDKTQHKFLNEKNMQNNGILKNHIDKILFSAKKDNDTYFYFDYGLLIKCLSAPTLECEEITDEKQPTQYQITLAKKHLLSYLSVIFQAGFILYIDGDKARPICFSDMQRSVPIKNVLSLVLDCSSSMDEVWVDYIEYVKNFVTYIVNEKIYSDVAIAITPFATTTEATKTFSLTELPNILSYLCNEVKCHGNTRLKGTLSDILKNITQQLEPQNTTVILFTDGKDNKALDPTEINEFNHYVTQLQNSSNPPKIYTLGLGKSYDKELLQKLADESAATHIKLDSIQDFTQIYAHCREMSKPRNLWHFIQDLTKFIVPAFENTVAAAKNSITVPGTFSVNHTTYNVSTPAPTLVSTIIANPTPIANTTSTTPPTSIVNSILQFSHWAVKNLYEMTGHDIDYSDIGAGWGRGRFKKN